MEGELPLKGIPPHWEMTTLGDVVRRGGGNIQTGPFGSQLHAADYVEVGIPSVMPTNIGENRILENAIARVSEEDATRLRQHRLKTGDIVYSRRGDVERRALVREREEGWLCGTGCLKVRLGKGIVDPLFASLFLGTPSIRAWIVSNAVGATMPNLNTSIMGQVPFALPPEKEQKSIAAILGALDDKIELNHRINAELEGMAKLLYDYWFVQFEFPLSAAQAKALGNPRLTGKPYKSSGCKMTHAPELKRDIPDGWKVGSLNSLGEILGGSTPSTKEAHYFSTDGTPWITPKDLSRNIGNKFITRGETDVTDAGIKGASLTTMPAGTVLMSSRAPIGYTAIARNPVTTNQGFKSFVPSKGFPTEFIYYTLNHLMKVIEQNASGSTFKEVSGGTLKSIQTHLPDKEILKDFTALMKPIFIQQDTLELQNQELTTLRDWLLPLLMNGQVIVR